MIVFYLMLAAIGLSLYHSYRIIRRGAHSGALVDHMLEARREKRVLLLSAGIAAVYLVLILTFSLLQMVAPAWVVLTPFVYLVAWSLPRLWQR
ncbi:MAG: hypothetical protein ACP5I4_12860 [Oceanipulchritudo sp.]